MPQKVIDKVGGSGLEGRSIQRLWASHRECGTQCLANRDPQHTREQTREKNADMSIKETLPHLSISLQVTGMIPMGYMGKPEGEH